MDIGEQEARRADNQIWNAAGAYGFATGSRGYEPNGEASLYFNTAIGLVRRLYDYRKLEILLTALERRSSGEMQSELLWLGLERCAYLRCRDARPALDSLRRDYAERQLQQDFSVNREQDRLKIGWFRRALGLPSEESDREKQILDALEWGSRVVPEETGGFLQVSGLTYEIHTYIESSCTADENGLFTGVAGEYRVKNVKVGGEDLDVNKTYTLACHDYLLKNAGDGFTMFQQDTLLQDSVKLDNQVLIDYITGTLNGVVGEAYANPYGQGRIVAVSEKPAE